MFLKLLYTLTIGITLTGLTAQASLLGGTSGGGGGAYVCRDKYNQIINSELLDLWEAKKLAKLDISRSEESIEIQIERALSKFPSHYIIPSARLTFLDKIKNELKLIQSSAHRLDDSNEISLQAPTDSNTNYQKRGCPLEGMMFYDGELGHVVYIGETYDKLLSNTDKAAIWVHEAIYKVIRDDFGYEDSPSHISKDSILSRKIVGCLFASNCSLEGPALTINELLDRDSSPHVIKCGNEQDDYQYFVTLNEAGYGLEFPTVYFYKVAGINAKYPIIYKFDPKYTYQYYYQGGLEKFGFNWLLGESRFKFPVFNYTDFIQGKMPECKRVR